MIRSLAPGFRARTKRKALILPYGAAPTMVPGGELWESLAGPARASVDVFGLTVPWGIVPEDTLGPDSLLLASTTMPRPLIGMRDGAIRVRAWLSRHLDDYSKVGLVACGPLMPMWTRAAEKSPMAGRVRLLGVNTRWRGLAGAGLRSQVRALVEA